MEFSLHQQLKEIYGTSSAEYEVKLGRYRIDAVLDGTLIEIQHSSLASIRDKIRNLCQKQDVLVVKQLIVRKQLIKLNKKRRRE